MICPNCGNEIPDGFRFCTICGTNLSSEQQAPVMAEPVPEQAPDFPEAMQMPAQDYIPAPGEAAAAFEDIPAEASAFVPAAPLQENFTSNYPAYEPVPMQMPEQPYTPAPEPKPAKEKRSGGFLRILPWILVGLLVIGAGAGSFLFYRAYNKLADQRDEYYLASNSLQAEYDELTTKYNDKVESYESLVDKKDAEIDRLNDKLADTEAPLSAYDDILRYAQGHNIGGSNIFGVSPAVVCMDIDDSPEYVTLYTGFDGKTVSFDYYGYSADFEFLEDNWRDVTSVKITPSSVGVTLFTLSLDDGSYPEFGLLVIVTDE